MTRYTATCHVCGRHYITADAASPRPWCSLQCEAEVTREPEVVPVRVPARSRPARVPARHPRQCGRCFARIDVPGPCPVCKDSPFGRR